MMYIMLFSLIILASMFLSLVILRKVANLPWCICFLCNIAFSILLVTVTFCVLINSDISHSFHEAIYDTKVVCTILGLQAINCITSLLLFVLFLFFEAKTY